MFQFGADPEIFLTEKGKPVSAYGVIEGTKDKPFKTERGAYQVDGMAVEFNIDPSDDHDFETFNLNIVQTLKDMKKAVGEGKSFAKGVTVQEFEQAYLDSMPEEAKELGCNPDFCAYTGEENPQPDGTRNFRTAAGHIHIGWGADIPIENADHREICFNFVKMLDAHVGIFMTFIDREPRRRELYGKAGACRIKPYGVEYRTPSNAWIWNRNRRYMVHMLLNNAIRANINYPGDFERATGYQLLSEREVRECIDSGDWATAQRILDATFGSNKTWTAIKEEMKDG